MLYGLVIDGTQNPHIERAAVSRYLLLPQPCLIPTRQGGIQRRKRNVVTVQKSEKTVQGTLVITRGTVLAVLPKRIHLFFHVVQETGLGRQGAITVEYFRQGVCFSATVQLADNLTDVPYLLFRPFPVGGQDPLIARDNDKFTFRLIPPLGKYPHVGGNLPVLLTVAKLVTERASLTLYRRWTEF